MFIRWVMGTLVVCIVVIFVIYQLGKQRVFKRKQQWKDELVIALKQHPEYSEGNGYICLLISGADVMYCKRCEQLYSSILELHQVAETWIKNVFSNPRTEFSIKKDFSMIILDQDYQIVWQIYEKLGE